MYLDVCVPAHLLHQVPDLAAFLAPSSLANLLACNRELRQAVHDVVCKVTVTRLQDLDILSKHRWSRLTIIHWLHDSHDYMPLWPYNGKLELLAAMRLKQADSSSNVFVVRAQKAPLLQHSSQVQQDFSERRGLRWLFLYPFFAIFWTSVFWLEPYLIRLCRELTSWEKQTQGRRQTKCNPSPALHLLALQQEKSQKRKIARVVTEPSLILSMHGTGLMKTIWPDVEQIIMYHSSLDDASIATLLQGPYPDLARIYLKELSLGLNTITTVVNAAPARLHSLWP